jgi:hypothetical protein
LGSVLLGVYSTLEVAPPRRTTTCHFRGHVVTCWSAGNGAAGREWWLKSWFELTAGTGANAFGASIGGLYRAVLATDHIAGVDQFLEEAVNLVRPSSRIVRNVISN